MTFCQILFSNHIFDQIFFGGQILTILKVRKSEYGGPVPEYRGGYGGVGHASRHPAHPSASKVILDQKIFGRLLAITSELGEHRCSPYIF